MQIRRHYTNSEFHLPLGWKIWSQIVFWGIVLANCPAWSTPLPGISRSEGAQPQTSVSQAAIATGSLRSSLQPPVDSSETARSDLTNSATALLPLESQQRTITTSSTPATQRSVGSEQLSQSTTPPLEPAQRDANSPQVITDPELGVLRLQSPQMPPPIQPTEGGFEQGQTIQSQPKCASGVAPDPELGCLPLRAVPPPPPARQPVVYLLGRVDYFKSSNVFSAVDPVNDGLLRSGLTLFATPALGPDTYFVGSIDGNLVRYNTQTQINYNELRLRAGIFQRLSPTMFGELGWSNQQLFITGDRLPGLPAGTRFLNDHAIRLELSRRDQLSQRLSLNTFYQLRISFANPEDRSRILNSVIASLNYDVQPNLQVGLDYQFALANFTVIPRDDQYHQLAVRLTYTAFRNTQVNLFAGYSFGRSSDPTVDFNSVILGVSLTINLGLF